MGLHMNWALGKSGTWLCATIATAVVAFGAGQDVSPVEKAQQVLNRSCTGCHEIRRIQVQALDDEGWTRVVNTMIEKGAEVQKDEIPLILEYLVRYHGPLPNGAGKAVLLNTCTMCHDLERVKRHGATREEWEETLIAMLNEGAPLSDLDFEVVLNYLARYFRPVQ